MQVSSGFLRKHWHNILFVVLLIVVYVIYVSLTGTVRYERRGVTNIENLANPHIVESKKDLEKQCNQLTRSNCSCHGSCGWLSLPGREKCVAGDSSGPYYRSEPIKPGQRSINEYYPLSSYEFRQCGK